MIALSLTPWRLRPWRREVFALHWVQGSTMFMEFIDIHSISTCYISRSAAMYFSILLSVLQAFPHQQTFPLIRLATSIFEPIAAYDARLRRDIYLALVIYTKPINFALFLILTMYARLYRYIRLIINLISYWTLKCGHPSNKIFVGIIEMFLQPCQSMTNRHTQQKMLRLSYQQWPATRMNSGYAWNQ